MTIVNQILGNADVASIIDLVKSYANKLPVIALAAIVIVLGLIETFAGKKLFGLQKFLAFLAVGFAAGVVFVAPLVANFAALDARIVGLVVGVVAAILYRPLYFVCYVGGLGFATYYILMNGLLLPEAVTAYTKGSLIICIVAAVVVAVIALLLRKWIETLALSALGAYVVYYGINMLVKHFVSGMQLAPLAMYVILGVFTLVGFIVQVATRKKN